MLPASLARRAGWLSAAAYVALALLAHAQALPDLANRTRCACGDPPQTQWFLAWTPHALRDGRSLLVTDYLNYPDGVNLMWNTLMPLPGLLAAPITFTAGPVASHTVLAMLALAGSALSMWAVSGVWVRSPLARFVAGLLYGFSPYMVTKGASHVNLAMMVVPPLVLWLAHEILVVQRWRPVRAGAALGGVAFLQFLISTEVLATTFLVAASGVVILLAQHHRRVDRQRVRHAAAALGSAVLVLAALAAWPLWVQLQGRQRLSGAVQDASPYAADLLALVVPTRFQLLGSDVSAPWTRNAAENLGYLGAPLLVVLLWGCWRYRQLAVVRFFAALGTVAWVLSLGERLQVAGRNLDVPLPFAAVARAPLLENIAAVRISHYVAMAAAVVAAILVQQAVQARHAAQAPQEAPSWRGALVVLATAACAVALLPSWPYRYVDAGVPAYFRSDAVRRIPAGSVALTYPIARSSDSSPMLWQAEAAFRYRSLAGYLITPRPDGEGTFNGGVTAWERAALRLREPGAGDPPNQVVVRLREELAALQVGSVVVADGPGSATFARLVARVLGRVPDEVSGGVTAWYDVLARPLPSA